MFPTIRCSWTDYYAHLSRPNRKIKRCKILGFDRKGENLACVNVRYSENGKSKQKLVSPISLAAIQLLWSDGLAVSDNEEDQKWVNLVGDSSLNSSSSSLNCTPSLNDLKDVKVLPDLTTPDFDLIPSHLKPQFAFTISQTNNILAYRFIPPMKQPFAMDNIFNSFLAKDDTTSVPLVPCSWTGLTAHVSLPCSTKNCVVKRVTIGQLNLKLFALETIIHDKKNVTKQTISFESPLSLAIFHVCWWDVLVASDDEEEQEEETEHHLKKQIIVLPPFQVQNDENIIPKDLLCSYHFLKLEVDNILSHLVTQKKNP